jgi:hypothetical protein
MKYPHTRTSSKFEIFKQIFTLLQETRFTQAWNEDEKADTTEGSIGIAASGCFAFVRVQNHPERNAALRMKAR